MLAARDAWGWATELRRPSPQPAGAQRTLETLESATADAAAALADIGAVAVREDINLEPAFWGQFPGNEQYVVRRALISSSNAAGFISLHGFPMGRAAGNHWGDAVTRLRDDQRDALLLQFPRGRPRQFHDHRPVGVGQDGGAQLPRRPGAEVPPRTILFDKDRGSELSCARSAAVTSGSRRARRPGFNPLHCPTRRPTARSCATGCRPARGRAGPRKRRAIAKAIDANLRAPAGTSPAALPARPARRRPPSAARRPVVAAGPVDRATASMPGCSTIARTSSTSAAACSAST